MCHIIYVMYYLWLLKFEFPYLSVRSPYRKVKIVKKYTSSRHLVHDERNKQQKLRKECDRSEYTILEFRRVLRRMPHKLFVVVFDILGERWEEAED